jgi:acyl-CoA synthetase (NDP forming)
VPRLTRESYDELATFFSLIGGAYVNPVDTGNQNRREMKRILEILGRDANIDNLVLLTNTRFGNPEMIDGEVNLLAGIKNGISKQVMAIVAFSGPDEMRTAREATKKFQKQGIPAFPSMERGARALKNTMDYYRRLNGTLP